jgi:hypothetical protein
MDKMQFSLYEPVQAHKALAEAWTRIKPLLMAGHRLTLEVKPRTRSVEQNALLHAMLGEIAAQVEWAGAKRDVECWKRLLVAAWCRARGESVELLPALDGHGVDIVFRRTSKMTVDEVSELCEFIMAWAAERGMVLGHE